MRCQKRTDTTHGSAAMHAWELTEMERIRHLKLSRVKSSIDMRPPAAMPHLTLYGRDYAAKKKATTEAAYSDLKMIQAIARTMTRKHTIEERKGPVSLNADSRKQAIYRIMTENHRLLDHIEAVEPFVSMQGLEEEHRSKRRHIINISHTMRLSGEYDEELAEIRREDNYKREVAKRSMQQRRDAAERMGKSAGTVSLPALPSASMSSGASSSSRPANPPPKKPSQKKAATAPVQVGPREIEDVLKCRRENGKEYFLVRRAGQTERQALWEPVESLVGVSPELIAKARGGKVPRKRDEVALTPARGSAEVPPAAPAPPLQRDPDPEPQRTTAVRFAEKRISISAAAGSHPGLHFGMHSKPSLDNVESEEEEEEEETVEQVEQAQARRALLRKGTPRPTRGSSGLSDEDEDDEGEDDEGEKEEDEGDDLKAPQESRQLDADEVVLRTPPNEQDADDVADAEAKAQEESYGDAFEKEGASGEMEASGETFEKDTDSKVEASPQHREDDTYGESFDKEEESGEHSGEAKAPPPPAREEEEEAYGESFDKEEGDEEHSGEGKAPPPPPPAEREDDTYGESFDKEEESGEHSGEAKAPPAPEADAEDAAQDSFGDDFEKAEESAEQSSEAKAPPPPEADAADAAQDPFGDSFEKAEESAEQSGEAPSPIRAATREGDLYSSFDDPTESSAEKSNERSGESSGSVARAAPPKAAPIAQDDGYASESFDQAEESAQESHETTKTEEASGESAGVGGPFAPIAEQHGEEEYSGDFEENEDGA